MDVPTDRLMMTLIAATAVAVFAVGWGFLDTGVGGQFLRAGLVIVFLAAIVGFWVLLRRMDENRDRAE